MQSKSCVYWIHLPEHTDVFTQGYVGVSKVGAKARYWQHKVQANNGNTFTLYNAMRKYGDKLIVDTLVKAPIEYCYELEFKLRPTPNIGYNIATGGVACNLGRKHTPEARAKISAAGRGRVDSDKTRKKKSESNHVRGKHQPESVKEKLRVKAKLRGVPRATIEAATAANKLKPSWCNTNADKGIWLSANIVYDYMSENPTLGSIRVAKNFGVTYGKIAAMFKKIKSGWNPNECPKWLEFYISMSKVISPSLTNTIN